MESYVIWKLFSVSSEICSNTKEKWWYKNSWDTNISDRIAQMVVKLVLEPKLEPLFYPDSYGYRPNKSALDAVGVTRKRC